MEDRYVVNYNNVLNEYYIKDNELNVMFYLTDKDDVENIANLLNKSYKDNLDLKVFVAKLRLLIGEYDLYGRDKI